MERSNDEPNTRLQDTPGGVSFESRPSGEARPPQTPRLQKKRSNPGTNPSTRRQTYAANAAPPGDTTNPGDATKQRKGSIRNAVRRLFSRRSREPEPPPAQTTPPRHGYHRSEPNAYAPPPQVPEGIAEEEEFVQRTLSAPIVEVPSIAQRTRSPYAVEFPQSSRLKPLNLSDPFYAPGSQLRRRKTLPSVLVTETDSDAIRESIETQEAPAAPENIEYNDTVPYRIGTAVSTSKSEKRRSRSLGDLKGSEVETANGPRKRSEEMRFWRESMQGTVLRPSGFRMPSVATGAAEEEREEERTPMATIPDPFDQGGPLGVSPASRRAQTDVGSPSALGTELSQDLENRVARLEAGLQNFRGELAQIASERNRRTVLIGGGPAQVPRRRASSGGRTASMLADTLQSDLEPSSYNYHYTDPVRPSTSPQPPRTPTRFPDPSIAVPAIPVYERTMDDPFMSPSPNQAPPPIGSASTRNEPSQSQQQAHVPQHTFRSLYEMLADERSARRRLETQMRNLRDEIQNLHYQVSLQSNVQSQRSSYYASIDPMVGSSRLHALLRETEDSRPGTMQSMQQGGTGALRLSTEQPAAVVSRFSGSESEGFIGDHDELRTPYDAYQTPREEQGGFPFAERSTRHSEGEMF